ncbi:MAG: hypothetical protein R2715_19930 [Ilumatobacteraceae bacterium]
MAPSLSSRADRDVSTGDRHHTGSRWARPVADRRVIDLPHESAFAVWRLFRARAELWNRLDGSVGAVRASTNLTASRSWTDHSGRVICAAILSCSSLLTPS